MPADDRDPAVGPGAGSSAAPDRGGLRRLLARYRIASPRVREMVRAVGGALRSQRRGDRPDRRRAGLVLLDKLDMEALFLYEKYPDEFHRLREMLGTDAAADVLLHWREYFGLKRGDETDRGILIAEFSRLDPAQRSGRGPLSGRRCR